MGVEPLPKWLQLRYASLWKEFGDEDFTFDKAKAILKKDSDETLNVVISNMRKAGYIEVSVDSEDKRKRLYRLISPTDMVEQFETSKVTKK